MKSDQTEPQPEDVDSASGDDGMYMYGRIVMLSANNHTFYDNCVVSIIGTSLSEPLTQLVGHFSTVAMYKLYVCMVCVRTSNYILSLHREMACP